MSPKNIIHASCYFLPGLVQQDDLTYQWTPNGEGVPNTVLSICIHYPVMMNFLSETVDLLKTDTGKQVLPIDHLCTRCFEQDVFERHEEDGFCYEEFSIVFNAEQ
eukprot:15364744-Ditylum_brightwellii.AAC.3